MKLARHGIEESARVRKTYLRLLRMHVDVDLSGLGIEIHNPHRIAPRLQSGAIRLRDGPSECPIAHGTPIDEKVQTHRSRAGALRRSQVRLDLHGATLAGACLQPLACECLGRALASCRHVQPFTRGAAVAREEEADRVPSKPAEQHCLRDVSGLRAVRLEKLSPRWNVEE